MASYHTSVTDAYDDVFEQTRQNNGPNTLQEFGSRAHSSSETHDDHSAPVPNQRIHPGLSVAIHSNSKLVIYGLSELLTTVRSVERAEPWTNFETVPEVLILACGKNTLTDVVDVASDAQRIGTSVLLLFLNNATVSITDAISSIPSQGFLAEDDLTPDTLETAFSRLASGQMPVPESVVNSLLHKIRTGTDEIDHSNVKLTLREQQTLELLVDGLGNKQIARRLAISMHGTKRLLANIFAKLNCSNRTEAVTIAIRNHLVAER